MLIKLNCLIAIIMEGENKTPKMFSCKITFFLAKENDLCCCCKKYRESMSWYKFYAYLKEGSAPWCHHHNPNLSLLDGLQACPHLPHPCDQGNCSCWKLAVHGCSDLLHKHTATASLKHLHSSLSLLWDFSLVPLCPEQRLEIRTTLPPPDSTTQHDSAAAHLTVT